MVTDGPFDAIHCHSIWCSGVAMQGAADCGVPIRIIHLHSTAPTCPVGIRQKILCRIYVKRMKRLINHFATHGIACGEDAGKAFWEDSWGKDPRWTALSCGVDLQPFSTAIDNAQIRRELNIPENAFVIGHIGRFHALKNHNFMIDIMKELAHLADNYVLLLIGTGSLQPAIECKAEQLGLKRKVIFAGVRPDIPQLLRGAVNCFLLPSLHEGMGLVGIEAQAAGLPCVISDHIPLAVEGNIVPDLIHPISLKSSAANWAKKIHKLQHSNLSVSSTEALDQVMKSKFNIELSVADLTNLYLQRQNRLSPAA